MKKLLILSLILFLAFTTHAQNIELLSLDAGELPVTLKGSTKDGSGFTYHFGDFRGVFSIGNDTLLYGNGGNDLFFYTEQMPMGKWYGRKITGWVEANMLTVNCFIIRMDYMAFSGFPAKAPYHE